MSEFPDIRIRDVCVSDNKMKTAQQLADTIGWILRLKGVNEPLEFVHIPKNSNSPLVAAFVGFRKRENHASIVNMLGRFHFDVVDALATLCDNTPHRQTRIPEYAQWILLYHPQKGIKRELSGLEDQITKPTTPTTTPNKSSMAHANPTEDEQREATTTTAPSLQLLLSSLCKYFHYKSNSLFLIQDTPQISF